MTEQHTDDRYYATAALSRAAREKFEVREAEKKESK